MATPEIHLEDFQKVDLRIGEVVSAERVEGTRALLLLRVNLGEEERTLVAGLAPYYRAEEIVGKKVVVVVNLEPAVIRGIKSQGMLLAADDGQGNISLVTVDRDIAPGSRVR